MSIKLLNSSIILSPPADSLRPLKSLYDFKGLVPGMLRIPRDESKRWPIGPLRGGFIRRKFAADKAFTLSELMIATLIFAFAFAGTLIVFFRCIELSEMTRNSSTAVNAAKSRLATIENTAFDQILGTYNNTTFSADGVVNGKGITYVTSLDVDLLQVTLVFCWREKNGRIMGEDTNINGALNAGEDANGNGVLDSPMEITTYIYDTT